MNCSIATHNTLDRARERDCARFDCVPAAAGEAGRAADRSRCVIIEAVMESERLKHLHLYLPPILVNGHGRARVPGRRVAPFVAAASGPSRRADGRVGFSICCDRHSHGRRGRGSTAHTRHDERAIAAHVAPGRGHGRVVGRVVRRAHYKVGQAHPVQGPRQTCSFDRLEHAQRKVRRNSQAQTTVISGLR